MNKRWEKQMKSLAAALGEILMYVVVGVALWFVFSKLGIIEQNRESMLLSMLIMVVLGSISTRLAIEKEFDELKEKKDE